MEENTSRKRSRDEGSDDAGPSKQPRQSVMLSQHNYEHHLVSSSGHSGSGFSVFKQQPETQTFIISD